MNVKIDLNGKMETQIYKMIGECSSKSPCVKDDERGFRHVVGEAAKRETLPLLSGIL